MGFFCFLKYIFQNFQVATTGVYRAPFATITIAFARVFREDSESGIESSQNEPQEQKIENKNNESAGKRPKHGQFATILDVGEGYKNWGTQFWARGVQESHREAPKSTSIFRGFSDSFPSFPWMCPPVEDSAIITLLIFHLPSFT